MFYFFERQSIVGVEVSGELQTVLGWRLLHAPLICNGTLLNIMSTKYNFSLGHFHCPFLCTTFLAVGIFTQTMGEILSVVRHVVMPELLMTHTECGILLLLYIQLRIKLFYLVRKLLPCWKK